MPLRNYTLTHFRAFKSHLPLKVALQRTFLFQRMNGLCTCITKNVIIFFKNEAAFFYKKRTFVNILCYNDHRGTILKFIEFVSLCHSQQCKVVHVCQRIIKRLTLR